LQWIATSIISRVIIFEVQHKFEHDSILRYMPVHIFFDEDGAPDVIIGYSERHPNFNNAGTEQSTCSAKDLF